MKLKIKSLFIALLVFTAVASFAGCSDEKTPYDKNNSENYTVSVKYDANGGMFTTNTSVIVDSYNIGELKKTSDGKAQIALLEPSDSKRGNDAFKATKNGCFLAGWYKERIETKDEDGNKVYTYSGKWDFESDILDVDASKEYRSEEPVVTLYAAWIPLFKIDFYSLDTEEYMESLSFDPTDKKEIAVPCWDEKTGAIEMYQFPERKGYTFEKAYFDAEKTQPVEVQSIVHTGVVDYETGTAKDSVMKLYVDWREGEWYRIYNAKQFIENASLSGNYEIFTDLDFEGKIWPTSFVYGNFTGKIIGNGHTMKNISITQTNNSKVNAGLFGNLTDKSSLSDITFENVNFTVKAGTRVVGTSYGLFAGTVSNEAEISKVNILNSTLSIDSSCYFGASDYSIGLVCGMGDPNVVDKAEITCVAVGKDPESIKITLNGNTVDVETE